LKIKKKSVKNRCVEFGDKILAYGNVQTGESFCNLQEFWDSERTEFIPAEEYEDK
jgi:hypothetical protein